jgi:hypothetical protein
MGAGGPMENVAGAGRPAAVGLVVFGGRRELSLRGHGARKVERMRAAGVESGDWIGTVPLPNPHLIGLWHRQLDQPRGPGGHAWTPRAIRIHANLAQIWAGFGSSRTPRPSVFGMRDRIGPRIYPVKPIRTHGRGMGRRVGDALSTIVRAPFLGPSFGASGYTSDATCRCGR